MLWWSFVTCALFKGISAGEVTTYNITTEYCDRDTQFEDAVPLTDFTVSQTGTTILHIPATSTKHNCWVILWSYAPSRVSLSINPHNTSCPGVTYAEAVHNPHFENLCTAAPIVFVGGLPFKVDYTQPPSTAFDIVMIRFDYARCQAIKGWNDTSCCSAVSNVNGEWKDIYPNEIICDNIRCIRKEYQCDNYTHCEDGRDEERVMCDELRRKRAREAAGRGEVGMAGKRDVGAVGLWVVFGGASVALVSVMWM